MLTAPPGVWANSLPRMHCCLCSAEKQNDSVNKFYSKCPAGFSFVVMVTAVSNPPLPLRAGRGSAACRWTAARAAAPTPTPPTLTRRKRRKKRVSTSETCRSSALKVRGHSAPVVSERRQEREEAPPRPRPLHLTTSLFIRSIAPEVAKDEVIAVRTGTGPEPRPD